MARFALMVDKWLANVGPEEPFVVKNCKYERNLHEHCKGYEKPKHTFIAPLCGRSEGHSSLLGSHFCQWSQSWW